MQGYFHKWKKWRSYWKQSPRRFSSKHHEWTHPKDSDQSQNTALGGSDPCAKEGCIGTKAKSLDGLCQHLQCYGSHLTTQFYMHFASLSIKRALVELISWSILQHLPSSTPSSTHLRVQHLPLLGIDHSLNNTHCSINPGSIYNWNDTLCTSPLPSLLNRYTCQCLFLLAKLRVA
jgi:hypothetical protein